jgi:hypothetical protein
MPTDIEAQTADRGGLSRSALLRRGWSHQMILDLLPEGPDRSVSNPIIAGGVAMQIFSLARIEAVEDSDRFAAALAPGAPKVRRDKPSPGLR